LNQSNIGEKSYVVPFILFCMIFYLRKIERCVYIVAVSRIVRGERLKYNFIDPIKKGLTKYLVIKEKCHRKILFRTIVLFLLNDVI